MELVLVPLMFVMWILPVAAVIWFLIAFRRMSLDVRQLTRAVTYLAEAEQRREAAARTEPVR